MKAEPPTDAASAPRQQPQSIASRYRVLTHLGRGGSADVYLVRELSSDRELALKRLRDDLSLKHRREQVAHLEREFYALSQLRHPRVIEVYDYGVSDGLPYYTMELLDGGDLRGLSPLPWRRACELIYDVASSLALLHSRRFVHRDVTPSNIRCTREGRAKLIDFGAMVPMGVATNVMGTPAYVAPEVQQRGPLDATTDLFSLGATLYFITTGKTPFAASGLAAMPAAWASAPRPPSQHVPEIPPDFDALVLSCLSLDPSQRPRSAFELMQRLAVLAGLQAHESAHVPQGYISVPKVVGRDAVLRQFRGHLRRAGTGHGGAVFVEGEAGSGRSRLLELCTLEAKTSGAQVVHVEALDASTVASGFEQLMRAVVELVPDGKGTGVRTATLPPQPGGASAPRAMVDALLALTQKQVMVIAIDDVHRMDAASLTALTVLARSLASAQLLLIATAQPMAAVDLGDPLATLKRESHLLALTPLTHAESGAMLASVFGAVANVTLLNERIFAHARGNPGKSLALAQYLVDRGQIVYASGAWSLPDELPIEALPAIVENWIGPRLAALGPLARTLVEAQALSLWAALRRSDYRALAPDTDARYVDDALTELIAHAIVRAEGEHYVFAQPGYANALCEQLDGATRAQRHQALARWAEHKCEHAWVLAYHLLYAGQAERAIDILVSTGESGVALLDGLDYERARTMLLRAIELSEALGRAKRERFDLMRLALSASLVGDSALYWTFAPRVWAQLEADSGLEAYRSLPAEIEPAERLRVALQQAQAQFEATPPHERGYGVDEALRRLALLVATSIGLGGRTYDRALLFSLPARLAPFVSLSPMVATIWENAEATCDIYVRARPDRAYQRWRRCYERLDQMTSEPRMVTIANAILYGLGRITAAEGRSEALHFIARLDREPLQRVNAMRVRRLVCLHHGDWEGAERAREYAEMMTAQASVRQIFSPPLDDELHCHWLARDLTGVKLTADRIHRLARVHPGWQLPYRLAQGYFDVLRGDLQGGARAFEECIERAQPDPDEPWRPLKLWLFASAAAFALAREQGRVAEVRQRAQQVLDRCRELDIVQPAQPIECELALAEAKSGLAARAIERIERVISEQARRGVSGLQMAAYYEARTRLAITLRDHADAARYAAAAAREYRFGAGTMFSTRYGQLLQEAKQAGIPLPSRASSAAPQLEDAAAETDAEVVAVEQGLRAFSGPQRVREALALLCAHGQATGGFLYLASGEQRELRLVESSHAAQPSDALARFAQQCFREQLSEAEMSAVLTELPWNTKAYQPRSWIDAHGERYEVLVLYSRQCSPPHIGLALLRVDDREHASSWSASWLEAIAALLSDAHSA